MILLPRFKYFLTIRELSIDFLKLLFSDMSNIDQVEQFETQVANYFNKTYCSTFSSFRIGLYHYLKSQNLSPGDEILLTPITIPDTVNVILHLGLRPRFVDIDEESHTICLNSLKSNINENTKFLLITYLSGITGVEKEIQDICKENNTQIIEDISQAYGSRTVDNQPPFIGDIQIGSLSSGKLISTYTGGFLLTNDKELDHFLKKNSDKTPPPKSRFIFEILSNFKIVIATSKIVFPCVYFILFLYWKLHPQGPIFLTRKKLKQTKNDHFSNNGPILRDKLPIEWFTYLNSWQAKVGLRFLRNIEKRNRKRRELAKVLYEEITLSTSKMIPKLVRENINSNFYHLPIKTGSKKISLLKNFFMKGIDSEGYGLNLCSEEEIFNKIEGDCPKAYNVKYQSIFIPLHESFSKKSIIEMANRLNHILENTEEK